MEWGTQALRSIVAATALAVAGPSTASAQARPTQAQEPSQSSPAAVDDHPDAARQNEAPATIFSRLSLFDHAIASEKEPKSAVESWLSGVGMTCVGCRQFETGMKPEIGSATAPWALQGTWRRRTGVGVVSAGFVGLRNYALPLSAAVRPDGALDPVVLSTVGGAAFLPGSRWSVTAGVEKTLATRPSGASVGVTADALIPVENDAVGGADPRTRGFAATTMRLGVVVRW
jgi:hypothetical protein